MATPGQSHATKALVPSKASGAKKPLHSLYETIVFVDVGPERKRHAIHKGLLCSRSGYFKAALAENPPSAEDQVVKLDEDPETFRRFNAWLYTSVLVEDAYDGATSYHSLLDIYLIAVKLLIPDLQNAAIDAIIRLNFKVRIPSNEIHRAWTKTAETSLLRSLLVDLMLNESDGFFTDQFQNHIHDYDISFVAAVAMRAAESLQYNRPDRPRPDSRDDIRRWLRDLRDPWGMRCPWYHIHEAEDAPCEGSVL